MLVFGIQISQKQIVYLAAVPTLTIGFGLVGYALYKKLRSVSSEEEITGVEDLELPLVLEHDYGDFRTTCQEADSTASEYLNVLPDHFFHFNANIAKYIISHSSIQGQYSPRALVLGRSTAALIFELSKTFREVKGIESSFTKVVTSFQFQNGRDVSYSFPLEGSYRTSNQTLKHANIFSQFQNLDKKYAPLQNVQIVHGAPDDRLSVLIGQFQVIVLFKALNTLLNPEAVLSTLHDFLEPGGLLFIISDYNWTRFTNRARGFNHPDINSTFEFLKVMLRTKFEFVDEINMQDVVPISLRSCSLHNYHVTTWSRIRSDLVGVQADSN